MSETGHKEFLVDDVYTMFQAEVTDKRDRTKTLINQVGGGVISAEQLGELFVRTNSFPGAKDILISPTNTVIPKKTIEHQLRMVQSGKNKPLVTPRPRIGKPVLAVPAEQVMGVPEAEIPSEGEPTIDQLPVKGTMKRVR